MTKEEQTLIEGITLIDIAIASLEDKKKRNIERWLEIACPYKIGQLVKAYGGKPGYENEECTVLKVYHSFTKKGNLCWEVQASSLNCPIVTYSWGKSREKK